MKYGEKWKNEEYKINGLVRCYIHGGGSTVFSISKK
jgi:hypothetical protein